MTATLNSRSLGTFAAVMFAVGGFVALIVWGEYSSWRAQVARIEEELVQTAKALVQHADDTLDMAKFPLSAVATQMDEERDDPQMIDKVTRVMRRQVDTTPWLDTLLVTDANGGVLATTADYAFGGGNVSDSEYFRFHKSSITRQPILGSPVKSGRNGAWVLPVTQRLVNPDGGFAGVVVAVLTVDDFVKFFQGFLHGSEGSVVMSRDSGLLLARAPFADNVIGTSFAAFDLFKNHLKISTSGSYHYVSPIDHTQRIGGYVRSNRSGLVILAAVSEAEALATWMKAAEVRWFSGIVLVSITGLLVWHWRRQMLLRQEGEALLAAREAEFRLLAEGSGDLIQRFDGRGSRDYLSPASREIFGIEPEAMIGSSVYDNLHEDDRDGVAEIMRRLRTGSSKEIMVVRRKRADGKEIWLETTLNRLPGPTGGADVRIVGVTRDVTRQRKIQEELDALANTDELTRLANRRSFNLHYEEMLARAQERHEPLSLLMIDADRFKYFNDTYGHAAGDDCLRSIAAASLGAIRRAKDLAARYGGEEIAILLPDTDMAGAAKVAEAIRNRVALLQIAHEKNLPWGHVTISIGTATLAPSETAFITGTDLFDRADHALYHAKNAGRNQVVGAADEGVLSPSVTAIATGAK